MVHIDLLSLEKCPEINFVLNWLYIIECLEFINGSCIGFWAPFDVEKSAEFVMISRTAGCIKENRSKVIFSKASPTAGWGGRSSA